MTKSAYEVFMVLGAIWLIIGLIIYKNMSLWPIGAAFLIVGAIGRFAKRKDSDKDKQNTNNK